MPRPPVQVNESENCAHFRAPHKRLPYGRRVTDDTFVEDRRAILESSIRLLSAVDALTDSDMRAPSLLPQWSVAHVLTHLARNADGMIRLVEWALTGVPRPMYDSVESRAADIETGSLRGVGAIALDLRAGAVRLDDAVASLLAGPDEARERLVVFGAPQPGVVASSPAHTLIYARLRELEIHHVDLGRPSYLPSDWSTEFVDRTMNWLDSRTGPPAVVGVPHEVLAWRLGRGAAQTVTRDDGSAPGEPPAW
ncbi:unannotated protein [freshwater metagenome]|uniref:Unannotated protein n=1 Tax=freshwater metagenome TaxID=449393 RepID=A0A6J7BR98_9ZZZZ|nr:maleylpyruvate isomerase family mycothiol-dependent enzyme [Actinomycetota bacterium]MSW36770.1 maleylpyruvate isomerase family mycothiol-dependent enzyme [Actinomycetota bacterium]MSX37995.1 maleylpyruvate isomerase family mycothiol-dependent enzyme [Actinomycetota bacterium]